MRTSEQYKALSVEEFTKAAEGFEGDEAGVYKLCRNEYEIILGELEREPFSRLLDCGCGTGPMVSLLSQRWPERSYTGIDLTPKMIEVAQAKRLPNARFVVGDCERLPFEDASFDVVICSMSFHHYPNPQDFFDSVSRVLVPGGKLVLNDSTGNALLRWVVNHVELPLANLMRKGDVRIYSKGEIEAFCERADLEMERFVNDRAWHLHAVMRKPR
ncbi:class I SAM-dependent methyltransferase [Olsenella urininfantis]|uniref:class I SAM-dependent methyltransferase n=1 Tax=Olsenella urininfantis TaxID=1871033 RepID=UPI00098423E4|nr:class I SAM-dependent methyltransferase [Olsenella urininfantis]